MKPEISVIIPVYNVAKYLPECLDSILMQTYTNIEVICVNDGSTDESAEILEQYAKKDARIHIITQQNSGVSAARNTGMAAATGDYLAFIDGDDFIAPNTYECLLKVMGDQQPDIVVFGVFSIVKNIYFEDKKYIKKLKQNPSKNIVEMVPSQLFTNVATKMFRTEFLRKNGILFALGVKLAEDRIFCSECLLCNPKVQFVPQSLYYYRTFREGSTMDTQYTLYEELACHRYMIERDFYKKAPVTIRFLLDIQIVSSLFYRYWLLTEENRVANIPELEYYRQWLELNYSQSKLKCNRLYRKLLTVIKRNGEEPMTLGQKIFSIKNSRDKQFKVITILGWQFNAKRR